MIMINDLEIARSTHSIEDRINVDITSVLGIPIIEFVACPLKGSRTYLTLLAIDRPTQYSSIILKSVRLQV